LSAILLFGSLACGPGGQTGSQEGNTGQPQEGVEESSAMLPPVTNAIAVLHSTEGSEVRGIVTFARTDGGIRVMATVQGLSPGEHGFHIHEYGDCSSPDASSAGGHFNPEGARHGAPSDANRHVGDLGNITADESGIGDYNRIDTLIAFSGSHDIIGRGLIVHSGEDDFMTQPTGGAGARMACGVIGIAQGGS